MNELQRRAQSQLPDPTKKSGDPRVAAMLWSALEGAAEDDVDGEGERVPHRFHSWPGGMHPAIARTVLDFYDRGDVVDCFSGGGTVGVEALLHKRAFFGVDLNPLGARVGFQRCRPRSPGDAAVVEQIVDDVTERSKDRVRKKVKARASVSDEVAALYLPHTLMELAGLIDEIRACPDEDARKLMAVVFSAILTKVSLKRGDTSGARTGENQKRVGRFFPSEQFQEKAHELLAQQRALFRRVGLDVPRPQFVVDDALRLPTLLEQARARADIILTSPPYGGTYDYTRHHAHRLEFLNLDSRTFHKHELGARRRQQTKLEFDAEVGLMLAAMSRALEADGVIVLVMGDGFLQGTLVPADAQIARLSTTANLEVVATASAPRTDWRGGPDRFEHLIALRRR